MSRVDVRALFAEAAFEVTGKKLPPLTSDTVIAKLGLDSVSIMELVGVLEERLSVRLPDEELADCHTIAHLAALLNTRLPKGTEVVLDDSPKQDLG